MRVLGKSVCIILITVFGFTSLPPGVIPTQAAPKGKQYILLAKNKSLPANLDSLVAASGGKVVRAIPEIGVAVVQSAEASFPSAVAGLPGIEIAEDGLVLVVPPISSIVVEGGAGPKPEGHDPAEAKFFDVAQWNMRIIQADRAWRLEQGDPRVKVAILDTGVDYTHQELEGKVDLGKSKSFFDEPITVPPSLPKKFKPKGFEDTNGHGTHLAAIVAAQGISVAGIAPHVTIVALKVGGREGFAEWSAIIDAIVYAGRIRVDVINASFGERLPLPQQALIEALTRAINYARSQGAIVVASVGNEAIDWDKNTSEIKLPAQIGGVVGASATGPFFGQFPDNLAVIQPPVKPYTDFGVSIVDLAAPGGSATNHTVDPVTGRPDRNGMPVDAIISACSRFIKTLEGNPTEFPCQSGRANIFLLGTSMSAAHVSGVSALVDSVKGGRLKGDEIFDKLAATAALSGDAHPRVFDPRFYGRGRVNALAAVECARDAKKCQNAP